MHHAFPGLGQGAGWEGLRCGGGFLYQQADQPYWGQIGHQQCIPADSEREDPFQHPQDVSFGENRRKGPAPGDRKPASA